MTKLLLVLVFKVVQQLIISSILIIIIVGSKTTRTNFCHSFVVLQTTSTTTSTGSRRRYYYPTGKQQQQQQQQQPSYHQQQQQQQQQRNQRPSLLLMLLSLLKATTAGIADSMKDDNTTTTTNTNSNPNTMIRRKPSSVYRILAYGDSLTAGLASFDNTQYYPYAAYLQEELNRLVSMRQQSETNNNENNTNESQQLSQFVVRYRGLPGWTTYDMIQDINGPTTGLQSAIQAVQDPTLSLVILLAGTNDLGIGYYDINDITERLQQLHEICYNNGVPHTIAIGIPSSGYQEQNPIVKQKALAINTNLQNYCQRNKARTTFVPFPFPYYNDQQQQASPNSKKYWSTDTLHLSKEGYQYLGITLAPTVYQLLVGQQQTTTRKHKSHPMDNN